MITPRHVLGFLFVLFTSISTASADDHFAPVGLSADLDAACYLASRAELEEAVELLSVSLSQHPDDPLVELATRDLERLKATIEMRESFFVETAAAGGKLRIEVEGRHRALRMTSYVDGVITFALNKYGVDELDASTISLRDLTSNWKNAKAEPVEVRAFALRLAGDKSWKSQWPRDEGGHEELLADLEALPEAIVHGERVLDLRSLENYVGRTLDRSDGRKVVALHERLFGGTDPQLEGDDGTLRHALRALVRKALVAAWGLEELGASLHATSYEIIGDELRLIYDFTKEEELQDWPQDELRLPFLHMLGVLRTPEEEWRRDLNGGFLEVLGAQDLRHIVPFKGPLHLRYPLQVPEVGKEGGMWMCGTFLNDDLERSYLVAFGMGYHLMGFERGRPSETKREQIYYEVKKNYFVDLTYDKTGVLTAFREDAPEASLISLKTRRVDHGHVSIGVYTDYRTLYDSFEIQGTPDLNQMDRFRDEWVLDRLAEMGY